MKPTIITYGVIGVGHIGNYHIQQALKIPGLNLIGIYDNNQTMLKKRGLEYSLKIYDDLIQLVKKCDAICIATPASHHYKIAKLAMDNNCHVFIEKPITTKLRHAVELVNLAKTKQLYIQVGHIERFNPAVIKYMEKNNNPEFMEIHRLTPFNKRGNDIDVILDLMIHDIDLVLYFKQQAVVSIKAHGVQVLTDSYDIANAQLQFQDGCVANITASRMSDTPMRKIRVFENKKYTSLDLQNQTITEYKIDNQKGSHDKKSLFHNQNGTISKQNISVNPANALFEELLVFTNSILYNKTKISDINDAKTALEIALQIQKKIDEQKK